MNEETRSARGRLLRRRRHREGAEHALSTRGLSTLERLAAAFGITVAALLDGVAEPGEVFSKQAREPTITPTAGWARS